MSTPERILIIDDDPAVVDLWTEVLRGAGYRTEGFHQPQAGLDRAIAAPFDLVLTDVEMPQIRGPELLDRLLQARPDQLVIMITAFGSIHSAVDALRAGAVDFVSKPCNPDALLHAVERALRERTLRRELVRLRRRVQDEEDLHGGLVAQSREMRRVLELARRVANTDSPVLLQGESGTGKTAIARIIHDHSPRREAPFVAINSSTLPAQVAEAELFGVRKGAYTDAHEDRAGLWQQAHGGTLFMDEVADLPLEVQAKLLKVLEEGTVRPLGSTRPVAVDTRLLAASNTSLDQAVAAGSFRADLRFRLDVLTIAIPPLRERPEDITPLVEHWLERLGRRHDRDIRGITAAGWRWLLQWPWPGNVREVVNRLERAIVFSDHDVLQVEDFADSSTPEPEAAGGPHPAAVLQQLASRGTSLAHLERMYLDVALEVAEGNKTEAARILGIDRRTLYRKLEGQDDAP